MHFLIIISAAARTEVKSVLFISEFSNGIIAFSMKDIYFFLLTLSSFYKQIQEVQGNFRNGSYNWREYQEVALESAAAETETSLDRPRSCCFNGCAPGGGYIGDVGDLERHHDPWKQLLHTDTELHTSLDWGLRVHERPPQPKMPAKSHPPHQFLFEKEKERWDEDDSYHTSKRGGQIWRGGR